MKIPGAYSQRDGRWGSQLLGYNTDNAYNIANQGCLVTAIANMLWYMGHPDMNPAVVNNVLKSRSGFVQQGLVVWGAVTGLAGDLRAQGTSGNLAEVERFVAQEGNFAILQVTKPGFPMHFVVLPLVGQIIDSWDGVLKSVGSYQFVTAHLYGDVTPDFVTSAQPAVAPAVTTPNVNISFTPEERSVTVVVDNLDVRTGPGTEYPGRQANTPDHMIHDGQVIHVTGYVEDDATITLGKRSSNRWLRTATDPAHWFAAAGTNYVNEVEPPAPTPAPVVAELVVAEEAPAVPEVVVEPPVETPAETPAEVPTTDETQVAINTEVQESVVKQLTPPLVKIAQRVVYISDIEAGKHVERVPAGIPFTFIVQVVKNGVHYGLTKNMLNTEPVHGVDLDQFKPQVQDITPPSEKYDLVDAIEEELKTQGPAWRLGAKILHAVHKDKKEK